jgi:hypothetical protein
MISLNKIDWGNIILISLLIIFIFLIIFQSGIYRSIMIEKPHEGFVDISAQTKKQLSTTDIFLEPEEARKMALPFYDGLNKRNIEIRKGTIKYLSLDEITPSERKIVKDAFSYTLSNFPLNLKDDVKIVITSNDTEGGMPHTHGDNIYIPKYYLSTKTADELKRTLTHELFHIHQRHDFYLWEDLYKKLGFKRISEHSTILNKVDNKIIENPDTWEAGHWEFNGQIGVMLLKDDAKTLKDHIYEVLPTNKNARVDINEFKKMFGKITRQIDHPNEISAASLENLIYDGTSGSIEVDKIVRCWLEKCKTT